MNAEGLIVTLSEQICIRTCSSDVSREKKSIKTKYKSSDEITTRAGTEVRISSVSICV